MSLLLLGHCSWGMIVLTCKQYNIIIIDRAHAHNKGKVLIMVLRKAKYVNNIHVACKLLNTVGGIYLCMVLYLR